MKKQKKEKKEKKNKINWRRMWKNNLYMLKIVWKVSPGLVIIEFLTSVTNALLSFLVGTYLYKYALNALQEGEELKNIFITLGAMVVYDLFCMVLNKIYMYLWNVRYPKVEAYINGMLYKKAVEVEVACFENPDFYDTYVKATEGATDRAFNVLFNVSNFVWVAVNVISAGTLIVLIDPIFMVLAFLPLICTSIIGKKRNRTYYDYNMKNREVGRQKDYVRRTFYLADYSKEMRLTEIWKVMYRRMHDSVIELKALAKKYGPKIMLFRYVYTIIFDVVVYMGSILIAAFKTLVKKNMLIGDCFVVINSITNIAGNINYAGNAILRLDEDSLYIDKFREFIEYDIKIPEDKGAPDAPPLERLEIRNVSFSYEGTETEVLKALNIKINKGEKIAIVGHNGAGKSTFIKLLQRLYDVKEGEILLNGEDIRGFRLSSYRSKFGTVFQDYNLFATTVAENVMLRGNLSEAEREKVVDALKRSGVYSKIESLPNGIDTNVTKEFDDNGALFSGGEAQKISIARIFVSDNEIVIMDEPTSALDPIAEQEMYKNMFSACEGKTVIFISHRLSCATGADRIYLFEDGRIVEEGTHRELLALGGKFFDMWHKQADSYVDADSEEVNSI